MTKSVRESISRITTRLGCRVCSIYQRTNTHYRVEFELNGRVASISMASTPSDRRATSNQLADVRRQLR